MGSVGAGEWPVGIIQSDFFLSYLLTYTGWGTIPDLPGRQQEGFPSHCTVASTPAFVSLPQALVWPRRLLEFCMRAQTLLP